MKAFFQVMTAVGVLVLLPATAARAADSSAPDWPCIQRKVAELSAGMMWGGPPPGEAAEASWRKDGELVRLVPLLAARRTEMDEVAKAVDGFAGTLTAADRKERLTLLFAGVLDRINLERRQIIAGIERYTRKQRELAEAVNRTRGELDTALAIEAPSDSDRKRRREIEQKLNWQTRIHEERERSLQFVCESPVILEQRMFAIAREIMNHLE